MCEGERGNVELVQKVVLQRGEGAYRVCWCLLDENVAFRDDVMFAENMGWWLGFSEKGLEGGW